MRQKGVEHYRLPKIHKADRWQFYSCWPDEDRRQQSENKTLFSPYSVKRKVAKSFLGAEKPLDAFIFLSEIGFSVTSQKLVLCWHHLWWFLVASSLHYMYICTLRRQIYISYDHKPYITLGPFCFSTFLHTKQVLPPLDHQERPSLTITVLYKPKTNL